jgi:hypothetical protein
MLMLLTKGLCTAQSKVKHPNCRATFACTYSVTASVDVATIVLIPCKLLRKYNRSDLLQDQILSGDLLFLFAGCTNKQRVAGG